MINLNLAQILTFIAVAESRGFRQAATALNLSQSAVSARVRQLEETLGVRLLNRTTRAVSLTAEGARMLSAAGHAIGDLQRLATQLRDEASLQRGRVTVTALPSVAATLLPVELQAFGTRHQNLRVSLIDCVADRAVALVAAGDADLAVTTPILGRPDLVFTPLFREECLVVVQKAHPLARRRSTDLETISRELLLLPIRGAGFRDTIEAHFAEAGITLRHEHEAAHLTTLIRLAEIGMGVSFVPELFVSKLDLSRCTTLRLRPRAMWRDIGIVTRRGVSASPAAAAFIAFLTERLSSEGGTMTSPKRARSRL